MADKIENVIFVKFMSDHVSKFAIIRSLINPFKIFSSLFI